MSDNFHSRDQRFVPGQRCLSDGRVLEKSPRIESRHLFNTPDNRFLDLFSRFKIYCHYLWALTCATCTVHYFLRPVLSSGYRVYHGTIFGGDKEPHSGKTPKISLCLHILTAQFQHVQTRIQLVPDVLENIFSFLNSSELIPLLSVSRITYLLSRKFLWRVLPSLIPLVKLLPGKVFNRAMVYHWVRSF